MPEYRVRYRQCPQRPKLCGQKQYCCRRLIRNIAIMHAKRLRTAFLSRLFLTLIQQRSRCLNIEESNQRSHEKGCYDRSNVDLSKDVHSFGFAKNRPGTDTYQITDDSAILEAEPALLFCPDQGYRVISGHSQSCRKIKS